MILVTGATGSIGRPLVADLVRRGEPVRAFVRDPAQGRKLGPGVDPAVGDLNDPAAVRRAMEGVDRVLLNAGGAVPTEGPQPMVAQQQHVIDAARDSGTVRHLVKISVWGAREGGELAEGAHWQIERQLRQSGLAHTILAPNGFMQNFLTGTGTFGDSGDLVGAYGTARVSYVDAADIAACAAALLAGPPGTGATHVVTGPESLDHHEIARLLSAAFGRRVRYVDLTPRAFAARLTDRGLPADFARDVATLLARVAEGRLAGVTSTVPDLTGRPARDFAAFLAAQDRESLDGDAS